MRGAAFLAGLDDNKQQTEGKSVIVVDVGGTTTDVGVLLPSGFPRQAAAFIEVAGVRTNFSMADVQSIALGGGSRVRQHPDAKVTVGPDSVGHNITRDAFVFGGDIVTTTDIVVAGGQANNIGDRVRVEHLNPDMITRAKTVIKKQLERIIDR